MNNKRSFISRLLDWMLNWGILIFPAAFMILWFSAFGILVWVAIHFIRKYW
jgi:hypothetical protein